MAHNEVRNVGHLLDRLIAQQLHSVVIEEIIVVASGCTDGTEAAVSGRAARDSRIVLLVQPERLGKASAINMFLARARAPVCVLEGADTLPRPDTIEQLVRPLADTAVGMTGARPVPLNPKDTFNGYVVHFLWEMHHQVSLRHPKCGELVAFRRVFDSIPDTTIVDEPRIESAIRAAGLGMRYVPEAVVYNLGPSSLGEIIMRRRSIVTGYLELSRTTRHRTSTQARGAVAAAVARRVLAGKEPPMRAAAAVAVELLARLLGRLDFHFSRRPHHIWKIAPTSKSPADFIDDSIK